MAWRSLVPAGAGGAALTVLVIAGLLLSGVSPRATRHEAPPLSLSIIHTEGSEVAVPAISPDGRRVAVQVIDPRAGTSDPWFVDVQTGSRSPLTMARGYAGGPVWSPDGTRLAYGYQPPGQLDDVYVKDLRNGQVTAVIESPAGVEHPVAWSHDGAHLLVLVGGYTHSRGWVSGHLPRGL